MYRRTSTRTLLSVGQSVLLNLAAFIHLRAPRVIVPSVEVDQIKKVELEIPALANTLDEDEYYLWQGGDDPTPELEHTSTSLSITYQGFSTKRVKLHLLKDGQISERQFQVRRFGDAHKHFPILVRRALLVREKRFYAHISNTGVFGAAQSFSNGPLSVANSNQDPLGQVDDYLINNLDPWQKITGFKKIAIVNQAALKVFRHHPAFVGRRVWSGAGDGKQYMLQSQVIEVMKDVWRLDDVWVLDQIKTTAREGQADSIAYVAGSTGFMGIYLIKPGVVDLSTEKDDSSNDYPDGAFAMAEPRVSGAEKGETRGLNLDSYINEERKCEYFRVIHGHNFFTPRASESGVDFGVLWTNITA